MAEKKGKGAFFTEDAFDNKIDEPMVEKEAEVSAEEDLCAFASPVGTQGRKGQKAPRMNLAIPEDVYEYIRRESRKNGMTYSEFICAVMRQRQNNNK